MVQVGQIEHLAGQLLRVLIVTAEHCQQSKVKQAGSEHVMVVAGPGKPCSAVRMLGCGHQVTADDEQVRAGPFGECAHTGVATNFRRQR